MGTIKLFKKFIEESIWSDMQDRSTGEVVRKEDDINNLDLDEFYTYIKNRYKIKVEYIGPRAIGSGIGNVLGVNITEDIVLFYKPKRGHILLSWTETKIPMSFFDELEDRFKIENTSTMRRIITEKDGSCTNKTFVDTIEFFLGHKESMMNESIWSDMQDRSSGEIVRKEDERQKILERLLATYIKLFAESCCYHDEYEYCSYPDFRSYIKDFRDNPRIEEVCPNNSYFDDLLDYVNRETWDNQIFDTIVEISQRIVHGEHPITDDVIEELRKHNVNESIWSDMQDRSAGDTVRQEEFTEEFIDKVESNLIGFTMLVVYYIKNYELTLDGFYKYLEENENPDEVKKIIYYVKTHKDECDKLLEKDIKFENKLLDEKVNVYLLRFVDDIVYDEKYHNTFSDIKKFASEIFKGYKRSYDFHINNKMVFKDKSELFNDYIEDKWKNSSLKQKIDDWIKDENDKISKYGFVKEPGKTISETVNDWWYSLDEDKRDDLGWDEFGDDAEEEYYTDNNPKYNEYSGEDFEADEWWDAAYGIRKVKIYCHEHSKTNESIWSDMQDRSAGDAVRKEDEMTSDDYRNLKEVLTMFGREVGFFGINKNQKFFPVNAKTYKITLEDCLYFIDVLADGNFTGADFSKLKRYIEANWEQDPMIKNIIQWTVDGENDKGIDRKIKNSVKREKTWDLYECDGVPGGLTPADVGGMGPAYFPGPNGEPGSGDLPSPTGIVYKQVAPFDSFIKIRKQKKKKKKFRKEDELCVHSENPPIYSHVDDFRDYVDRTYDNIDKKK